VEVTVAAVLIEDQIMMRTAAAVKEAQAVTVLKLKEKSPTT
jgi:hypothetical protein